MNNLDDALSLLASFKETKLSPVVANLGFIPELGNVASYRNIWESFKENKVSVQNYATYEFSGELDWSIDPYSDRSWCWSLHIHRFLLGFVSECQTEKSLDFEGLELCLQTLRSNYAFLTDEALAFSSEFAWHDHTTANRLLSLCYFFQEVSEHLNKDDYDFITKFIALHCEFLATEWLYTEHTNHGLDQAKALYLGARVIQHSRHLKLSLTRIRSEINFAFTEDGVHVENSPGYHQYVLATFYKLKDFLSLEDYRSITCNNLFLNAFKYLVHASRPDRNLPLIGDTELIPVKNYYSDDADLQGEESYKQLQFIASDSLRGLEPDQDLYVSSVAGYAYSRDSWANDATYLSFKSGCLSNYHRQADDLSITLFAKGEDWILDGGMYNHNSKDPVRKYMRSIHAHSSIYVVGSSVRMRDEQCRETSKVSGQYSTSPTSNAFSGSSRMQLNFLINREVLHSKAEQRFEITDTITKNEGDEAERVRIRFLIAGDKVITQTDEGVLIKSPSDESLFLSSDSSPESITITPAKKANERSGYASQHLNKLEKAHAIDFYYPLETSLKIVTTMQLSNNTPSQDASLTSETSNAPADAEEFKLLYKYILRTEKFWPKSHVRNAQKLQTFLLKTAKDRSFTKRELIDKLILMAKMRRDFAEPHIYLSNPGSAGSHWIEKMLAILSPTYNCGEVYLPRLFLDALEELSDESAEIVLDVIYLLHTGKYEANMLTASLINSAHYSNPERMKKYSPQAKTILLIRDPAKIVESRTFRKDEYKSYLNVQATESEYIDRNCNIVETFYNGATSLSHDATIKYEDFVNDSTSSLKALAVSLDLPSSDESIAAAITATSEKTIKQEIQDGKQAATNLFIGERLEIPAEHKEYIRTKTAKLRKQLGYL